MNKFSKKKPPATFEIIGPTLQILDNELRDCVARSHEGLRKGESIWPVHQINWQRSRYVYDMYKIHGWITKECYQYCERMKMIDVNLIAKWKKSGYENLCSTFAINSKNYKFGTVSVCRVPRSERRGENKDIQDPNTGCLGCASGKGGYYNIFGNKYGQRLAAIQVAREKKKRELEERKRQAAAEEEANKEKKKGDSETDDSDSDGDSDSDSDSDDDDFGPQAAASSTDKSARGGVWAKGEKELEESNKYIEGDWEDEGEEENEKGPSEEGPPMKKARK